MDGSPALEVKITPAARLGVFDPGCVLKSSRAAAGGNAQGERPHAASRRWPPSEARLRSSSLKAHGEGSSLCYQRDEADEHGRKEINEPLCASLWHPQARSKALKRYLPCAGAASRRGAASLCGPAELELAGGGAEAGEHGSYGPRGAGRCLGRAAGVTAACQRLSAAGWILSHPLRYSTPPHAGGLLVLLLPCVCAVVTAPHVGFVCAT